MTAGQKTNKPLFSQHYLNFILPESPEWQEDVTAGFTQLNQLYLAKKNLLPNLSEAQTEDIWIKPLLQILGFSYIPQVVTRGKGRAQRPDYALFSSESDRDAAASLQNDETAFYHRVIAIAEAKYWSRPLSKVSPNDNRDIYKNENPSFQIASYLTGTGVDWGILTNGREWRLYYRQASSTATEFYQVDLVELLEAEDLEQFKYFWRFFRQAAFVKSAQGRNFLERVREGSTTYATRVGNELKTLVFEQVFPQLAGGFVADATRRGEPVTPEPVYEATLSFLYKLLFLLYAEARYLLPIEGDYRDYSIIKLTQDLAAGIDRQKSWSQTSTAIYDKLLSLFQIIDRGDKGLGVPRYNGGLFHFDFHQPEDIAAYPANHFLSQFKVNDAILAPVLDQLARFEGQPIDYSFLGVRQLGSIYEGLLEYRVIIEDAARGQVHLENDKGDRRATGSYYTPEYIVKYIVSQTLKPVLEQREARFREIMAEISQIHEQMEDKRLGGASLKGLQKQLQRLERAAQSTLLDIKICDPAMGSGHFLVEAVDYLTDELIGIFNQYPEFNPVLEMLEQTRQSILGNLGSQGIAINPDRLEPTQLLQRVVMKRCIYGVDLNPIAVELAKVSLWLHSFTVGAPLSFLDHHLRCGNSLIGTTASEAEAKMTQEESGQLNLLTGPFVGLLRSAEIMRGVSVLSDATFAEVEQSEKLFRDFDAAAQPYKRLLDIYVAQFFGVKQADSFLRVYGKDALGFLNNPHPRPLSHKGRGEGPLSHLPVSPSPRLTPLSRSGRGVGGEGLPPLSRSGRGVGGEGLPPLSRSGRGVGGEGRNLTDTAVITATQKLSEEKRFFHWDLEFPEVFIDLENASWHENGGFDAVVGNPPYDILAEKERQENLAGFTTYLKSNPVFAPSLGGKLDLFRLFMNRANYLLSSQGCCGMIIPMSFLGDKQAVGLRKFFLEGQKIRLVNAFPQKDDPNRRIFPEAKLPTCIVIFSNDAQTDKITVTVHPGNRLDEISGDFECSLTEIQALDEENLPIPLLRAEELNIILRLLADVSKKPGFLPTNSVQVRDTGLRNPVSGLKNICPTYQGEINETTMADLISTEPDSGERILRGGNVQRYEFIPEPKQGVAKYLNVEKYRQVVGGDRSQHPQLTRIGYQRNAALDNYKRLIFAILPTPCYCFDSISYFLITDKNQALALLAMLNSRLLEWRFRLTSSNNHVSTSEIAALPIPKFTFTTPQRQQAVEYAITLYHEYQTNGHPDAILSQVQHHLSQEPEESDVIHDFLADLAEQMTELNQQKQGEIKGFLQWLERFIGCPLDNLTNKSKIQNYLGDYYKDEPHLSLDDLMAILKKNQKKLKINPVARQEQQTLAGEYQASLDKLLPLKRQLMRCDKLIDRIVYQLYGLSEEEIAIVEDR